MVRTFALLILALAVTLGGVIAVARSGSDPSTQRITYLDQGWNAGTREHFYYITQGTVIMPASWLAAMDAPDGQPLMSQRRMQRLGFVYDDASSPAGPYHWPIGFAIDNRTAVPTVGLTCAACHTGQITYRGAAIRIDGGQANINLDALKSLIDASILSTGGNARRLSAFERRAVRLGYPRNRIVADFNARYQGVVRSGAARAQIAATNTLAGPGRNDALAVIARILFNNAIDVPSNTNRGTAPVDYPYLWGISHLNWVQYNGSVRQPMARNIGEALGVGAQTHFINPATGALSPLPGRWRTSIPIENLHTIETMLATLQPPPWPQSVLGRVDRALAARGRQLFVQNCSACHGIREIPNSPGEEWSVKVIALQTIGTDPMQARNFAQTVYDGRKLGLSAHATAAEGLQAVTSAVRTQAYIDAHIPRSLWPQYDGFGRQDSVTAPCGYKARPLVGVWATPPFLHNGSVPSIFALLSDTRPRQFWVGSTEFDPRNLGIVTTRVPGGMLFDTSIVGNSNAGHWFADDTRPGRIGHRLTVAQRYAIIEYLKIASYANYPHIFVTHPDPEPCVGTSSYGSW